MSFALDHVVVRVPDPDGLAWQVSKATGLPVLRGWTPEGVVRSRGVRFANGPFLDIHEAAEPQAAYLGVRGPIAEAERLAILHDWRVRGGQGVGDFPWRILLLRRGQGVLTAVFVIEYSPPGDPLWTGEDFSGELFRLGQGEGPRLRRVGLAAPEEETAEGLAEVLPPEVEVRIGPAAEVVGLEVAVPGAARPERLQLTPSLALAVRPAP